jgi:hypothetical protein
MHRNALPKDPLKHVRRTSHLMVAACWVLMILLPLSLAVYWAVAGDAMLARHANLQVSAVGALIAPWQRLAGAGVMALPLGLLLAGLWQAKGCFEQFAQGRVFTRQATERLRRFAGWVASAALAAIVASAATSVLLTMHNPPGMRQLAIGVGSNHLFTLFFAGLVWLMAAVIGQGQALAEENEGFV